MPGGSALQVLYKLVDRDLGMSEDTAQGANGQFAVKWNNATHLTAWRLPLQYNVAATLPDSHKSQAL